MIIRVIRYMKKKRVIISLILVFFLILFLVGSYFTYQYLEQQRINKEENEMVEKIKNNYSAFVETTDNIDVFKKNKSDFYKVGIISKNTVLELESIVIDDSSDTYFPIKDTNYFVSYEKLQKSNENKEEKFSSSYLLKKKIHTIKTNLYKDNNLVFSLEDEYDFDVYKVSNDNHYVSFLGNIYYIKDNFKEVTYENDIKKLEKISIINFDGKTSIEKLNEVFNYLKENKYKTITVSDYSLWLNGEIDLETNSVLLLSYVDSLSSSLQELIDSYDFIINTNSAISKLTFTSGDQQIKIGDQVNYKYEFNSNTSLNRFKDMMNGIKEVSVSTASVAVLNYHFFYDSDTSICTETICISTKDFREQLDYLKENGYKTLTMKEFNDWMDGKISVPKKSVLITIDDGAAGTSDLLPAILDEYKMHATLFLISGWWPISNYQKSPYLEIQSHGHDLHHNNYCDSNGCGYKTLKLSRQDLINDLKTSTNEIGTNLAFCYPFYQTNSKLVQAVKDSGFKLAFVGGNKKATRQNNKYYIPRYVIYKNTSLSSFIKMVS